MREVKVQVHPSLASTILTVSDARHTLFPRFDCRAPTMARPEYRRRPIRRGRFCDWPEGAETPKALAERVTYTGNRLHKTYPSAAGSPAWPKRADKARCDHFASEHWPKLLGALKEAIYSGSVAAFRGEFPSRAWVWINETLHEARLTGDSGDYHGFPLDDPLQYPTPVERLKDVPRVTIPVVGS